jgi:hypothetical protein
MRTENIAFHYEKSLGNLRNNEQVVILKNEDDEILRKINLQREFDLPIEEHTIKEEMN